MITTTNGRTGAVARTEAVVLTPVRVGDREIGAYVSGPDGVRYVPAVDVSGIVDAALGATVVVALAAAAGVALRRRPAIGTVTMGPGGWVSLKRTAGCAPRSAENRPWWARLLGANRLEAR